jgi:hypothetical protein
VKLTLHVPITITKLQLVENGTAGDGEYSPYRFSFGQAIYPDYLRYKTLDSKQSATADSLCRGYRCDERHSRKSGFTSSHNGGMAKSFHLD